MKTETQKLLALADNYRRRAAAIERICTLQRRSPWPDEAAAIERNIEIASRLTDEARQHEGTRPVAVHQKPPAALIEATVDPTAGDALQRARRRDGRATA